jgi:uncharacterized protein YcaQ
MPILTLDHLRRYAIARTLFKPTTLKRAIQRLGFVQADPIRAPARAQDLTLRHRVKDYRAGDLERRYPKLDIEEDCFVNYGFLPRETLALMHPREPRRAWDAATQASAQELLDFIRARGKPIHPREVLAAFSHGRVEGYWGGTLNASTQLLDGMHYRGLLRVVRRDSGTRVYAANEHPPVDDSPAARRERAAALFERVVRTYAPLPSASLGYLTSLLGYGAPQLRTESREVLAQVRARLPQAKVDGTTWHWAEGEEPASRRHAPDDAVRLLAPFDPVVWDRRRFELLWGWTYKFEAYTPPAQRRMGHYALPLLWGEQVIGWGNLRVQDGRLVPEFGFIGARPRSAVFKHALDQELQRMHLFLGLGD